LLKIDFKNAFNSMERAAFVPQVVSRFPGLSAWTRWCYDSPPALIYDHRHVFWSENGVQQGDPLVPLYFCCGLQPFVDKISLCAPSIRSGTWSTVGSLARQRCSRKFGSCCSLRPPL